MRLIYSKGVRIIAPENKTAKICTLETPDHSEQILPRTVVEAVQGMDAYVGEKLAEAGDMQSSVYDPQGRGEDVFAAIDAVGDRVDVYSTWEAYDPAKTYHPGNKVSYEGSSYLCLQETLGTTPTQTGTAAVLRWDEFVEALRDYWIDYDAAGKLSAMLTSADVLNKDLLLRKDAAGTEFGSVDEFMAEIDNVMGVLDGTSNVLDYIDYDGNALHLTWYEFQYLWIHSDEISASMTMVKDADLQPTAQTDFPWFEWSWLLIAAQGVRGETGKTAYQYAVDGGYIGTEAEFVALMGTGPWLPRSGGVVSGTVELSDGRLNFGKGGEVRVWCTGPGLELETRSGDAVLLAGVADPPYDLCAANKRYVDTQIQTRAAADHVHTAEEVGADPAGSAAAVDTKLTAHAGNRSNPHGVTAEQVGARPTAWTPSKADVGLGSVPNVATNDQTPTFTQASARANLASGEKLSVLFGKLMKWFSDLKTVAFTGAYSDLTDKPTSMTPVAHKATHKTGGEDAITPADIGAAAASHGTHVTYSTTAPVMDGAAAVGTAATVARGDHRHPVDTSRSAKSTLVSTTIGTTWDGSVGAWTQTLNIAGVTATNVVEVFLSKEATDTQDEAFTALQLRDGGQAAGSITLKAKGAKNTISIPITVIVRGDL